MSARITRRRMLAASAAAGAPLALAACGQASEEDDRSEADDPDLLNAVLAQHLAVEKMAKSLDFTEVLGPGETKALLEARKHSISELEAFIAERDGEATTEPAEQAEAESQAEALALQLEGSIEASLEVVGDLSAPAYRQAVHRFITEDAVNIAALRSQLGGDIAPDAFVFGPPASEGSE